MILFNSSSIAAGGYDARSGTLRLRYIDGDTYDYRSVPSAVFDDLLDAPSKGRFVNWCVKPHYVLRPRDLSQGRGRRDSGMVERPGFGRGLATSSTAAARRRG